MSIQDVASIATTVAILLVIAQLALGRRGLRTNLEDSIAREFRDIARGLPLEAFLPDRATNASDAQEACRAALAYLDLSNEQVYLRAKGRVSGSTWRDWSEGIQQMLRWPAVAEVWAELRKTHPDYLSGLERLEANRFGDPLQWVTRTARVRRWIGSLFGIDVQIAYGSSTAPRA